MVFVMKTWWFLLGRNILLNLYFDQIQTGKVGGVRLLLKCDGKRAETRFCLPAKWTSPFKSAGAFVQSTTGSRGVHISGSNAGYTMFQGWCEGYWLPTPLGSFPFTSPPCVTVCHYVSTGLYLQLAYLL